MKRLKLCDNTTGGRFLQHRPRLKTSNEKLGTLLTAALIIIIIRPRRWIVTIPSLDQWLATIGNHWKTIVSNEKTIEKPSVPMVCQTQNHWKTIVSKGKTIEKPLVPMVGQTKTIEKPSLPMVCQTKNHWYRWLLSNHSFKGTSEYENLGVLQLKSQ